MAALLLLALGLPCVKAQTTTGCPPDIGAATNNAFSACESNAGGNATLYCPCFLQWLTNGTGSICFYATVKNPWLNPMMPGAECQPTTTTSTSTLTTMAGATPAPTTTTASAATTIAPCPGDGGALANVVLAGCVSSAGNSTSAQCVCYNTWWGTVGNCPGITTNTAVSIYVAGKNQCAALQASRTSGAVTVVPTLALCMAVIAGSLP